jgi:hypothetical protein
MKRMKAHMNSSSAKSNTLISLLVIAVFLISCCAIHAVHKHCIFKAEPPSELDASCQWFKTDKAGKSAITPSTAIFVPALFIATAAYLFFIGTLPVNNEILKTFSPPSSLFSRAPPRQSSL